MDRDYTSITWDEAVRSYLIHLKAVRAPKTVLFYHARLRVLTSWAEEQGIPLERFGKRHMDEYLGWFYPYTAGGKQQTCLSNLHQVGTALSLYYEDYAESYPPIACETKDAGKVTWVKLLRAHIRNSSGSDPFLCPAKGIPADEQQTISSFGMNSALSGPFNGDTARAAAFQNQRVVVALADRGDADRLSLFSPYEDRMKKLDPPGNIKFRHGQRANVLYMDGHSASVSSGPWVSDPATWGGPLALQHAARGFVADTPVLKQIEDAFSRHDDAQARKAVEANPEKARQAFASILALWKENNGDAADKWLEGWGWQAGQFFRAVGHREFIQELDAEQSRRSQEELVKCEKAPWQHYESPLGFSLDMPSHWTVSTSESGRYRQSFIHSGTPYISLIVEKGTGYRPPASSVISWKGTDAELRRTYGSRYHLVALEPAVFVGSTASAWLFDLEKKSEPLVHKRMVGGFHGWDTYSLLCAAPARDYGRWQTVFDRIQQSFRFRW